MLCAVAIELEALTAGTLLAASGRDVHGLWFHHWQKADSRVADQLHAEPQSRPFSVSPLLGLGAPHEGRIQVTPGACGWFRVTTLTAALSERLQAAWLPQLPEKLTLGPVQWRLRGFVVDPALHPWAGVTEQAALVDTHLRNTDPPREWRLRLATPTTFHAASGHLPFPLPGAMFGSWLRRWQAFGTVNLPENLGELAQQKIVVSGYQLQTVPVRDGKRLTIGCVGQVTVAAPALKPGERAALDLLAAYAFWCGTGHRSTQGLGMTRVLH
ncbi:MAG: CRISPR system precrRNA processing endoribonuclease RAMP protein Cas6 [Anaerolineae bacterium]|nr:CRISPR system precrRNA processing endoribonuclease RAMP protein Cas6 [Anaerolineae bacterium]